MSTNELFEALLKRFHNFELQNPLEFRNLVSSYKIYTGSLFRHVKKMHDLSICLNNPEFDCIVIENPSDIIIKIYKKLSEQDYFCYVNYKGCNGTFIPSLHSTTFEDEEVNKQICLLFDFKLLYHKHRTVGEFSYQISNH